MAESRQEALLTSSLIMNRIYTKMFLLNLFNTVSNRYILNFGQSQEQRLTRGTSSHGRALALHARGTGIDTPVLHR